MQPAGLGPKRYGGRFETEHEIGHGGMGAVYRARDLQTGASVALKVLYEREGPNAERFTQEAAMLAELSHPAIVRYVHHGVSTNGEHYLAMEWLSGPTLEEHLVGGALPVVATVEMAARIVDALSVAHRRGVVHRDLKPGNIILPESHLAAAKLLDFGIARRLFDGRRITRTGNTLGTPMYMSPEQARGAAEVDARSDVFSMGCVLFECLTGKPPFTGETPVAVLAKICLENAPPLRPLRPELPVELDLLVRSMLEKDPAKRPGDAAGLSRVLAQLADDLRRGRVERPSGEALADITITPSEQRLFSAVLVQLPRKGPKASPAGRPAPPQSSSEMLHAVSPEGAPPPTPVSLTAIRGLWRRKTVEAGPAEKVNNALTSDQLAADLYDEAVMEKVQRALVPLGARVERFYNGSLAVTATQAPSSVGQTVDMARCAIELKRLLPTASFAVASARAEGAASLPVGRVLESAGALLVGAPGGTIRLDALSAELLNTRFELTEPELDTGNGKPRRLLYEKGLREPPRTVMGRPVPWVGRDRELTSLHMLYGEVVDDKVARAAIVTGPPGVGKSRLRHEVLDRIYAQGVRFELLAGRGEALRAGDAWSLLGSALRAAANVSGYEALDVQRKRFAAHVGRRFEDANTRRRVVAFMGEIANIRYADDDFPLLQSARQDPRAMSDQTRAAWMDWVQTELAAGPVVLMFEDAHFGDVPSFMLTDLALRVFHDKPLLVLAFGRSELVEKYPHLWEERSAERIDLAPLRPGTAKRLVQEIWPEASDAHAELIAQRTDGNPFFIEELVRVSLERGPEALADTPMTVLAVIQDRLDGLGEHAKRVLRAASVFGMTCRRSGVGVLLGETNLKELEVWLEMLADREILFRRNTGAAREYVFRQALVREASYATLVERDRVAAHAAAGEFLEKQGGENAAELAEHFMQGQKPLRAGYWFRVAGERALGGSDLDVGLGYCDRALACGVEGEELGLVKLLEARLRFWRGDVDTSKDAAEQAVGLLEGVAHMEAVAELTNAYGHMALEQGRPEALQLYMKRFQELAALRELPDGFERWFVQTLRMATYAVLLKCPMPIDWVIEEATAYQDESDPLWTATASSLLAQLELVRGQWREAAHLAQRASSGFRRIGNVQEAFVNDNIVASSLEAMGQLSEAAAFCRAGFFEAERYGVALQADTFGINLAKNLLEAGQPDEALSWASLVTTRARQSGNRRLEAYSRMVAARACVALARLEEGAIHAEAAVGLSVGEAVPLPAILSCRAFVHVERGNLREALDDVLAALRFAGNDSSFDALFTFVVATRVFLRHGDRASAKENLERALLCVTPTSAADATTPALHRELAVLASGFQ